MVSASADHFLLGTIFLAADHRADLHIHGAVSPSLIRNLIDFQNAWHCWWPHRFEVVEVTADLEMEDSDVAQPGLAICAYSGGVDSTFSIYRHKLCDIGRQKRNIESVLLVHGFDIALEESRRFDQIAERASLLLNGIGLSVITMSTNFREINTDWIYTHGAALASALCLFKRKFSEGIIAGTCEYSGLLLPWGSNPVTDHLLSSKSFQIVHDAPHWMRNAKLMALAAWPEAYNSLRVCFACNTSTLNCGKCFKCISTWFGARAMNLPAPQSIPDPTVESILALDNICDSDLAGMQEFALYVQSCNIPQALARAFQRCINSNLRKREHERRMQLQGSSAFSKLLSFIEARTGLNFASMNCKPGSGVYESQH
jgi:hypothetical protein